MKFFLSIVLVAILLSIVHGDATSRHTRAILSFGPRTPGELGHRKTKEYIKKTFAALNGWTISTQKIQPHIDRLNTELNMENIVATFNLQGAADPKKTLILACHYDSKYFTEFAFLGATDSAVPCAILLTLAKQVSEKANILSALKNTPSVGRIQLVFFDGEEAFGEWSNTDSKYGSKALARAWETSNELPNISLFMLLDLIGAKNPSFHNYLVHRAAGANDVRNTERFYQDLVDIEKSMFKNPAQRFFKGVGTSGPIDDDHMPFVHRGVPVLHIIPSPFPKVWHTANDDESAIHWPSTRHVQAVIFKFVFNYVFPSSK